MDNEFEAGGKKFKVGKLDAFKQFHIVRRIGPLIAELVPSMTAISKAKVDSLSEEQKLAEFSKLAAPLMQGLSKLSDDDSNYVLFKLLSAVEVYQPEFSRWSKVASDNSLMMQDIELPVLLQMAGQALRFNLSGFLTALSRK